MSRHLLIGAVLMAALASSGCDAADVKLTTSEAPAQAPGQAQVAAPLTASGAPEILTAEPAEENIQWAASVVQLDPIPDTDAKLFGTAGGDPAINGLYTYLAIYQSTADGWAVYKIGDFNEYRVLSTGPNRVDLEISQSTWNSATDSADTQVRKVLVQWTPGEDGAPPTSVTVTPGQ